MKRKPTKEEKRIYNMRYRLRQKGVRITDRDRTIWLPKGMPIRSTLKKYKEETKYEIQYLFI